MYDDGGVKFAEEQFAQARARDDEESRKIEKFAKKLTGLNTLIKGVNVGLNFLADDLDAKQVPQKTSYMNFLESTNARRKLLQPYSVADDKVKYVEDYIYGKSILDLAKRFPTIDPISYENYARDYAKNQAPLLAPEFEKMFTELQDIPDQATFETEYSKYQGRTNPRGIFGNVVKLVRNTFKKEDEESLAIKNAKAKDAIYGSPLFNEIVGAREAVEAFESKFQTGGSELIESILQAKKEGKLRGKYDISKAQYTDKIIAVKEDGSPVTKKVAVVIGIDIDGAPSVIELETGKAPETPDVVPVMYDWDDKAYLEKTAANTLAAFQVESSRLFDKYNKDDKVLMTGLVSKIVEKAQNYVNTRLYDKKNATEKAIKDFVAAHKDLDTYLGITTVVTKKDLENDSPVSLIIDRLEDESRVNNFDDTKANAQTIKDAITDIQGNIDISISIDKKEIILDNINNLASFIVQNEQMQEDEKVELIEGLNETIMKKYFDGAPLLNIDTIKQGINKSGDKVNKTDDKTISTERGKDYLVQFKDAEDYDGNLAEDEALAVNLDREVKVKINTTTPLNLKDWKKTGNISLLAPTNRSYLNNFASVVNDLDLSSLNLEQLQYLRNIDENLLKKHLGMPEELEFEKNPLSFDTRLDEVVKKYIDKNYNELISEFKKRKFSFFGDEDYALGGSYETMKVREIKREKAQPSKDFFEQFKQKLLN